MVSLGLLFVLLMGSLIYAAISALARLAPPAMTGWLADLTAALVVAAGVGVLALALRPLGARLYRQWRMRSALQRDATVPECLVITPLGIAFHAQATQRTGLLERMANGYAMSQPMSSQYVIGGYPYAWLRAVERRAGFFGAPLLHLQTQDGASLDLLLTAFASSADAIAAQAGAAHIAYVTRQPNGAHSINGQVNA